ncbi:MAG: hydrogenase maturation protease [Kiritimatiellae bacterium]|nr:hydrogenase maturation protease [Kiritimatiellia bacterium]
MNPTVVIGLGNRLLSDEGIGLVLLEALAREAAEFPAVDFLELGTGGMAVLHALAGRKTALILDCARMGAAPGTMRRFTPDTVRASDAPPRFSLHEGNVLDLIALARRVGECPERLIIFGIQPGTLVPGETVSQVLQARLPDYLGVIGKELYIYSGHSALVGQYA